MLLRYLIESVKAAVLKCVLFLQKVDLYEQFRIHEDIFLTFGCHPGKVQEYNDVTKAQMLEYVENWGKKVCATYSDFVKKIIPKWSITLRYNDFR